MIQKHFIKNAVPAGLILLFLLVLAYVPPFFSIPLVGIGSSLWAALLYEKKHKSIPNEITG